MIRAIALCCGVLVGCNDGENLGVSRVDIGEISVAPPLRWTMSERGPETRVWVPVENPRRESVTVIIGPRIRGGAELAFTKARAAQNVLHDVRVSTSERFTTPSGLQGLRLDLRFRPDSNADAVYQRTHAVLFVPDDAGDYTVHVVYTAANPDASRAEFARVLGTLEKGA
jgi:hypothetical protein